jgi:hypothetical protein
MIAYMQAAGETVRSTRVGHSDQLLLRAATHSLKRSFSIDAVRTVHRRATLAEAAQGSMAHVCQRTAPFVAGVAFAGVCFIQSDFEGHAIQASACMTVGQKVDRQAESTQTMHT